MEATQNVQHCFVHTHWWRREVTLCTELLAEWQMSRLIATWLLYITTDCTEYDVIKVIHTTLWAHILEGKSSLTNQNNFSGTVDSLLRGVQMTASALIGILRSSTLTYFRLLGSSITWFHSMGSTFIWIYPVTTVKYLFWNTYTSITSYVRLHSQLAVSLDCFGLYISMDFSLPCRFVCLNRLIV
jgi:hypothetical protein